MSRTCQRIYHIAPDKYYAVFARYFFPKKVIEFQIGDVQVIKGVFYFVTPQTLEFNTKNKISAGRKMYCGGMYFKSFYEIDKMLNLIQDTGEEKELAVSS